MFGDPGGAQSRDRQTLQSNTAACPGEHGSGDVPSWRGKAPDHVGVTRELRATTKHVLIAREDGPDTSPGALDDHDKAARTRGDVAPGDISHVHPVETRSEPEAQHGFDVPAPGCYLTTGEGEVGLDLTRRIRRPRAPP